VSLIFSIFYRIGFTPWERNQAVIDQLGTLLDAEQAGGAALDVGCGTGGKTVLLAQRGWAATGVDVVPLAVERARKRAQAASVTAEFLVADVTKLRESLPDRGYRLLLDIGCFHVLGDQARAAYGTELTAVADTGATLLLFAFPPGWLAQRPRGASGADLQRFLPQWRMTSEEPAIGAYVAGVKPQWYRLVRN
jgi:cyclopropane fatty-acyl-phospholipid synthase-like methyltransferase